jgi:hypothetical protein
MHPAAALLGYGMLGLATAGYGVALRVPRRAAAALAALLAGGGLAAFFWVPVALEWDLVHGDRAAINLYAYFFHFVDPWTLVFEARQGHTPAKIPRLVLALIGAASVALVVRRRSVSAAQWRLVAVLWLMMAVSAFMMGSASRPVWDVLPFLHRIQFPWRLMVVVNVVAAALSGCTPAFARTLAALAIGMSVWTSLGSNPLPWSYPIVETRADILIFFARPDAVDEWLPRDARAFKEGEGPWQPRCDPPECRVRGFERAPGRLRFEVTTPVAASVTGDAGRRSRAPRAHRRGPDARAGAGRRRRRRRHVHDHADAPARRRRVGDDARAPPRRDGVVFGARPCRPPGLKRVGPPIIPGSPPGEPPPVRGRRRAERAAGSGRRGTGYGTSRPVEWQTRSMAGSRRDSRG